MKYVDEYILALKQKVNSGMTEKKEVVFNGLLEMPLLVALMDMPEERIQETFLSEVTPAYVKATPNGELTMCLDLLDSVGTLERDVEKSRQYLKILNPGSIIYEGGNIGENVRWFDSKVFMYKETYYKLYFFVEKDGQKVCGSFQCAFGVYDKWKTQIMEIISQIN